MNSDLDSALPPQDWGWREAGGTWALLWAPEEAVAAPQHRPRCLADQRCPASRTQHLLIYFFNLFLWLIWQKKMQPETPPPQGFPLHFTLGFSYGERWKVPYKIVCQGRGVVSVSVTTLCWVYTHFQAEIPEQLPWALRHNSGLFRAA